MPIPELDPDQRRANLAKAAEVRRIRAELKQMLKAGEVAIDDVLERANDSEALAGMRVSDLIEAMPGYGRTTARQLMERIDISPTRRVRGLGPNQRRALIEEFGR